MASINNVTVQDFKELFTEFPYEPNPPDCDYVTDEMILRAMREAKVNFRADIFEDDETAILLYLYLTAHYLVIDLNNAMNPLALGFGGFTQSKSVGSVSESYAVPQWMLNNPLYSSFLQTGYGRKYISLIQPYMVGNIIFTAGRINFG